MHSAVAAALPPKHTSVLWLGRLLTLHQYCRTHEILLSGHSTIVPTCHAAILLKAPLAQAVAVPKQMVLYDSGHNWQLLVAVFLCGM